MPEEKWKELPAFMIANEIAEQERRAAMTHPTEAGERKAFTNNEETPMHCCEMECGKDAEFAIYGDSDHPEDYTHACADHVGHLLGTPDWLVKERGGKENVRWNVVVLTDPRTEP